MAASEWEERQQRLDKEKGFFRGFGACSVSLVGKNCGIRNIVWLLIQSHGGGDFQVSKLQVKSGIVCSSLGTGTWSLVSVRMFFSWPVFPAATMTEAASYCTSSRCTFLLVNTFLLFLNSKQLFRVNGFNLLFQPNWGSRN